MKIILIALVSLILSLNLSFAAEEDLNNTSSDHTAEIPFGRWLAGGLVGTLAGYGIGNAIEGTYMPNGLIFTVSEAVGTGLIIAGAADCISNSLSNVYPYNTNTSTTGCNTGLEVAGLVVLLGFHIWEIVDVWTVPHESSGRKRHDSRVGVWGAPLNAVSGNGVTNTGFVGGLSYRL